MISARCHYIFNMQLDFANYLIGLKCGSDTIEAIGLSSATAFLKRRFIFSLLPLLLSMAIYNMYEYTVIAGNKAPLTHCHSHARHTIIIVSVA